MIIGALTMTNLKVSSTAKNRLKTDKSLRFERKKTDLYLDTESRNVEEESDETVLKNRLAADKKLEQLRAKTDNLKIDPDTLTPMLDAERSRSDEAQQEARDIEDNIRNSERLQKRLITEAFLESERQDTDSKLHNERFGMDQASKVDSTLVSNAELALVTRDQYLAIVSHDLKNPLNAISLSASNLRRSITKEMCEPVTIIKALETVERNVATMDRMISDLLDVERMSSGSLILVKTKCNIKKLLEECEEIFRPALANKKFALMIEPLRDDIFMVMDHDRILQVLSNLIGNALKFTPNGGLIKLSAVMGPTYLEISVIDNGPGVPEKMREQIFERFSQLKLDDRRGLGLGLFISKWIVTAHGGKISVKSQDNKGSTFSFQLPLVS